MLRTDVFVLNISTGFAVKLCLRMALLCQMLDEHFLEELVSKMSGREMAGRTVANVMTKAALLEHMWMSGSWPMIFLTLETGGC